MNRGMVCGAVCLVRSGQPFYQNHSRFSFSVDKFPSIATVLSISSSSSSEASSLQCPHPRSVILLYSSGVAGSYFRSSEGSSFVGSLAR